jgi:hypothetical protein
MELFWVSLESERPLFTASDLRRWPEGYGDKLRGIGLLRLAENATHVVCPGCEGGHVEQVIPHAAPSGVRFYVRCPEALRVEVPAELLRQWTIDFEVLARAAAGAINLMGRRMPLIPARLWQLGKTRWQGASREVLLARGLDWPDGGAVAGRIGSGGRPIVLVAERAPAVGVWPGRVPAVILLSRVASLGATGIEVDTTHMMLLVKDADATAEAGQVLPLDVKQKKLLVRRQVKAEIEAHLEDDVLIAAYKEFNSLRVAADALTEQLGRTITKDKVYGAVQRAGGVKAVARTANSQSVRRTVVSQRRDSGQKILHRAQHPEIA